MSPCVAMCWFVFSVDVMSQLLLDRCYFFFSTICQVCRLQNKTNNKCPRNTPPQIHMWVKWKQKQSPYSLSTAEGILNDKSV